MTDREELEKAWIAVEAHCIVSPSGATPVWRDFRRDLITKFVAAKVAAVRAETLREVAKRMDEAAKRNLVDGYHETAEAFTMARNITLALAHPEGTDK
jgi:hypothetical protein